VEIAGRLADVIADLASGRPRLAVAFDGPDAAGKTALADHVARRLGQPAIRADVDGFHLPSQVRYQRAEAAPEEHAHIVIGNDDPGQPTVIKWQPPGPAAPGPARGDQDPLCPG
jgi:MoxR-like ATPase